MWGIPNLIEEAPPTDEETDDVLDESETSVTTRTGERMFERMEDVELVLRFFAYGHIQKSKTGLNRISDFLDNFLREGNKFSDLTLSSYEILFTQTMDFLFECLGTDAFAVISEDRQARPTKIVYDSIMFVSNYADVVNARKKILAKKSVLKDALILMYAEDRKKPHPSFAGRRTNSSDISSRNRAIRSAFESVLRKI